MPEWGRKAFEIGQLYGPQNRKPSVPPIDWKQTGYNALEALKGYLTGNLLAEAPVEPLMQSAASAATLPRDVYQGTVDPRSEEGIGRAFELASNVGLGARAAVTANPRLGAPGAAPMFIGTRAQTADMPAHYRALELEKKGANPTDIWEETMWGRDPRGNWFSEVSDEGLSLSLSDINRIRMGEKVRAGGEPGVFPGGRGFRSGMGQPAFLQAYPHMQDFTLIDPKLGPNVHGVYWGGSEIGLNPQRSSGQVASTAAHEFQHAIQGLEGWPSGSNVAAFALNPQQMAQIQAARALATNPAHAQQLAATIGIPVQRLDEWLQNRVANSDLGGYEGYRKVAGEVQARNTQTRLPWTMEQRRETPPWFSQDVQYPEQLNPLTGLSFSVKPRRP